MTLFILILLTNLIFIISLIYCLYLLISNYNKIGYKKVFVVACTIGLIQSVGINMMSLKDYKASVNFYRDTSLSLYVISEYFTLILFFYNEVKARSIKVIVKIIAITSIIILAAGVIDDLNFIITNYETICLTEAGLMIFLSISILIDTLFDDSINSLFNSQKFLIASGVLFLFSITLPYYILTKYLNTHKYNILLEMNLINLVGYSIFYSAISKSIKLTAEKLIEIESKENN
jgi:hypothetical protein